MSADVRARTDPGREAELFYSAGSLRFARNLLSDIEDQLKENAIRLAIDAGRKTITEQDMRDAALGLLKPSSGLLDDPDADDA